MSGFSDTPLLQGALAVMIQDHARAASTPPPASAPAAAQPSTAPVEQPPEGEQQEGDK